MQVYVLVYEYPFGFNPFSIQTVLTLWFKSFGRSRSSHYAIIEFLYKFKIYNNNISNWNRK